MRPVGSPEIVIATVPLNPFVGVTDTWNVEEVPGAIDGVDGVATIVKEAGGGEEVCPFDPPPPQSTRIMARHKQINISQRLMAQRPSFAA